jgi:hypothetical protein
MEFKHELLNTRFTIPDRITVRQQLAFISEASSPRTKDLMENLWTATRLLILEWECPHLPDRDTNLDSIDSPKAADVILWASLQVRNYIQRMDEIPKN